MIFLWPDGDASGVISNVAEAEHILNTRALFACWFGIDECTWRSLSEVNRRAAIVEWIEVVDHDDLGVRARAFRRSVQKEFGKQGVEILDDLVDRGVITIDPATKRYVIAKRPRKRAA